MKMSGQNRPVRNVCFYNNPLLQQTDKFSFSNNKIWVILKSNLQFLTWRKYRGGSIKLSTQSNSSNEQFSSKVIVAKRQ